MRALMTLGILSAAPALALCSMAAAGDGEGAGGGSPPAPTEPAAKADAKAAPAAKSDGFKDGEYKVTNSAKSPNPRGFGSASEGEIMLEPGDVWKGTLTGVEATRIAAHGLKVAKA